MLTLKDIITDEEQETIKDNQYLRFVKNQYNITGRSVNSNITITVRLGKFDTQKIIRKVLDCFTFPLNCRIDFWAVLSSLTR